MAKSKFAKGREYVRGAASRRDFVYILSKGKVLLSESIAHTSIIGNEAGAWVSVEDTDWDSTAITIARAPAAKIVVIGEDGRVLFVAPHFNPGNLNPMVEAFQALGLV